MDPGEAPDGAADWAAPAARLIAGELLARGYLVTPDMLGSPYCPGCGRRPTLIVSPVQAFCGEEDCLVFSWDLTASRAVFYERAALVDLADLGAAGLLLDPAGSLLVVVPDTGEECHQHEGQQAEHQGDDQGVGAVGADAGGDQPGEAGDGQAG